MKRTLLLCAALFLFAPPALAADEAVQRFERGVQLYEAENYDGALVEWSTAYKLSKNYKLLYNIGICQTALKDYPAATEAFQKYLAEGGSDVSAARKADVQERLSKLALMVTRVRISTDAPAGTALKIDEQPAGTAPFADPVVVKLGHRVFSISANGRTATKTVDITSGENAPITLNLADAPAPPTTVVRVSEPPPKKPVESGPSFPWLFWGVTAVFGGGAAVTGILALDAKSDFEKKQATFGVTKRELDDERSKTQTMGIVTDALLAGTVIMGTVSVFLTVRYFGKKKHGEHAITLLPNGIGYARSF